MWWAEITAARSSVKCSRAGRWVSLKGCRVRHQQRPRCRISSVTTGSELASSSSEPRPSLRVRLSDQRLRGLTVGCPSGTHDVAIEKQREGRVR
jgi:hypothetical protein